MQSLLLFNPGVTLYATRRETQVLPAREGRQNGPSNKEIANDSYSGSPHHVGLRNDDIH